MEASVSRGIAQHKGTGSSSPERTPFVLALLEATINPTIQPVDPKAGSLQAKQLLRKEYNPTHQQIIGLKFY